MREGDDVFAAPALACLVVNGAPHAWRGGMTVADVLLELGADDGRVATALHGLFVARSARPDTALAPDDRLSVFSAIVGG